MRNLPDRKNLSDILINSVERIGVEMNIDNERNTKFKYFPKISSLGHWNICGTYEKKYDRGDG